MNHKMQWFQFSQINWMKEARAQIKWCNDLTEKRHRKSAGKFKNLLLKVSIQCDMANEVISDLTEKLNRKKARENSKICFESLNPMWHGWWSSSSRVHTMRGRRKVWKSGRAHSNVVGIMCPPLVEIVN